MKVKGFLRKYGQLLGLAHKCLDALLIFSTMLLVAFYYSGQAWNNSSIVIAGILASALFLFFSDLNGMYKSWRTLSLWSEFQLLCYTQAGVILGLLLLGYATQSTSEYSRLAMGTWAITTPFILFIVRITVRKSLRRLRMNGYNSRRVAVLGHGPIAQHLVREIMLHDSMGMQIAGFFDDRKTFRDPPNSDTPVVPIIGNFDDAIIAAKSGDFDELYIALPMNAEAKIAKLIFDLGDCSVAVHMVPDLFTFNLINARTSMIGRIPTVSIYESPLDGAGALVKKAEDFVLTSIILLIICLPMIAIAIAIKLTSKGPVLFKQRRYGLGGNEIMVWKFRSMTVAQDDDTVVQATKGDRRITPLGRFLRKTSLDELPQFINVMQGQMSIVGPRPHAVVHNELYRKSIDGYMLRHLVKPGITGWAQINGWRGETDSDEKMMRRIEYDLDYIKNWSLRFDLKIIVLTVFKGFINKNAY